MASELQEHTLYNGQYTVVHNPTAKGGQPRYVVNGTLKPRGVTTILGETLSKDFTQWALNSCIAYLKQRLPDITEADLLTSAKEHIRLREAGGSTGTEAHALVEAFLKSQPNAGQAAPQGASPGARNAFQAFVRWFTETQPTVLSVEELVFSPRLGYAGKYDCLLRIHDKVYLCDLKTTNPSRQAPIGIYADFFIQLAAYALAYEEHRRFEIRENGHTAAPAIEGLLVISAKKDGHLDVMSNADIALNLKDCLSQWERVLALNTFMRQVTKRLGGR